MAVSITQAQATVAIRAAPNADAIPAPVATVIGVLWPGAVMAVVEYAPDAPDAMHDAAVVRLLGWMWDAEPTDPAVGRAIHVSGAAPLLAPFRKHRAGAIGAVEPDAGGGAPVPPGAGLPPLPAEGSFILTVKDGELTWVAFPLPPA